jgi:DNA-binding MurR/RpiR family transcriptional regulator
MSTSTIDQIKREAQRLRRQHGLASTPSLDRAAKKFGFESFAHAKFALGHKP